MPEISGHFGMLSWPTALTRKSLAIVYSGLNSASLLPLAVVTLVRHFFASSSQVASSTVELNRTCWYRLYSWATRTRYDRISSWPGYSRVLQQYQSRSKILVSMRLPTNQSFEQSYNCTALTKHHNSLHPSKAKVSMRFMMRLISNHRSSLNLHPGYLLSCLR